MAVAWHYQSLFFVNSCEAREAVDRESLAAASQNICRQLFDLDTVRDAKTWFIYASRGSEVETQELIRSLLAKGTIVTVPLVVGAGEMISRQIHAFDDLRPGEFGILAPPPGEPFAGAIDVCVCPGLAFTARGDRLGSGRGFYDRYLATHSPRLAIGLALECQMVPELPSESHDRRMNYLVTEQRVIRTG